MLCKLDSAQNARSFWQNTNWEFFERTRIPSTFQNTRHFIEYVFVETKQFVSVFQMWSWRGKHAPYTRQRSNMFVGSKRQALGKYLSMCYVFLLSIVCAFFVYLRVENCCGNANSGLFAGRLCAAVFFMQVSKKCTNLRLHPSLLSFWKQTEGVCFESSLVVTGFQRVARENLTRIWTIVELPFLSGFPLK
jgi:hypothetical protein